MNKRNFKRGVDDFRHWLTRLFQRPAFLFVSLWGHFAILVGAITLRHLEAGANSHKLEFIDAYYWAISVVTTVGNSDVTPVTTGGKILGIVLMILGSLFLWSYTALFAASLVAPEVKREIDELGSEVAEMDADIRVDASTLRKLIHEVQSLKAEIRKNKI